jgi:hypothetical protein
LDNKLLNNSENTLLTMISTKIARWFRDLLSIRQVGSGLNKTIAALSPFRMVLVNLCPKESPLDSKIAFIKELVDDGALLPE